VTAQGVDDPHRIGSSQRGRVPAHHLGLVGIKTAPERDDRAIGFPLPTLPVGRGLG
jgi:hypothetical protein